VRKAGEAMTAVEKKRDDAAGAEPLPIWFFVGVILLVYGLLVLAAHFLAAPRETVLASTKPALWWGAVIVVAGGILLGIGLKARQR
jgi:hypothetical protein